MLIKNDDIDNSTIYYFNVVNYINQCSIVIHYWITYLLIKVITFFTCVFTYAIF